MKFGNKLAKTAHKAYSAGLPCTYICTQRAHRSLIIRKNPWLFGSLDVWWVVFEFSRVHSRGSVISADFNFMLEKHSSYGNAVNGLNLIMIKNAINTVLTQCRLLMGSSYKTTIHPFKLHFEHYPWANFITVWYVNSIMVWTRGMISYVYNPDEIGKPMCSDPECNYKYAYLVYSCYLTWL